MPPTFVRAGDATMKKTEDEVAVVLIYMKKLLRLKNQLRSSFLRLPTEIIVHILSFVMRNMRDTRFWRPVFCTCHRIYRIMSTATELWWLVDCTWPKTARTAIKRSKGNPQMVIAELNSEPGGQEEILENWREQPVSHGHRLHTLWLRGFPSDAAHFSWIYELSLPRLRHLTVGFSGTPDDEGGEYSMGEAEVALLPITLQLPTDMPLRALRLRNATPSWSSNLFGGLRELCLDLGNCPVPVEISEDELFRIFDASSQLERLSLVQIGPRIPVGINAGQSTRERTARLPSLTSLLLENVPEVIGYILAHIDIPSITSLQTHSRVLPEDVTRTLNLMVPDNTVQKRLVSNPPAFEIRTTEDGTLGSLFVEIGSFKTWVDFDLDDAESICGPVIAHLQPLVPPSTIALKIEDSWLGLDELGWRGFVVSHPEVRSIECSNSTGEPMSGSLWDALSPTGTDPVPPCPKLESISLLDNPASPGLLNCLMNRKNAGFELKYLKTMDVVDGLAEEFSRLVETLTVMKPRDRLTEELKREVRPV